ncbi:cystathionine gamma-lyase [Streptomyces sp. WMMC500]|uniref:cystathionine gamma-lyase n=1 Tax=Streptomyces sp. WMMC500 TaxID=3015154 RepID=UPI00248CA546|nr:cystathionine gamma-lyase [Streptomyces sp. WMMC500]WBB57961.1 cystathionine gamma-lyase [Streptomyces sp. WMMC500]
MTPDDAQDADATRVVRAGLPAAEPYEPALPGPVFAAHYHLPGDVAGAPYDYGRDANPTWTRLEAALAELESPGVPAEAVAFASGMAAITAVLMTVPGPAGPAPAARGHVVLPSDGYNLVPGGLRTLLEEHGTEVRAAPTAGDAQAALLDGARLLWLETPSNPGLDVCDVRRLAAAAHAAGALVAVDNTLPTPLGQRPLELGADLSVASGTKALTGHGDVLLGYAVTRDPALARRLRTWRKTAGAVPGPMEAWLAHRSLATLELRTARQAANALAVAEALHATPGVRDVRHPGLPSDPAHALAARQMRAGRYGCVVAFTLPDRAAAERFLGAARLVDEATSFGGVRSSAERRGRWGGDAVPEGFVRFSAGVEDTADLVADLREALAYALAR